MSTVRDNHKNKQVICERCDYERCNECDSSCPNIHCDCVSQLEEAAAENERLREKIDRWVQAYQPSIINYPTKEAIRAVNRTPEFEVGRNAMMQAIHDGLQAILDEKKGE